MAKIINVDDGGRRRRRAEREQKELEVLEARALEKVADYVRAEALCLPLGSEVRVHFLHMAESYGTAAGKGAS